MIPKVIHYCWFGGNPLPDAAKKCIESWKKYCPDYEIKEWNEDNFDVEANEYIAQAYKEKKYAFVSDYARFWILNCCGGIYFDTDVEIIKNIDDIIENGPFMACERKDQHPDKIYVAPGLGMAAEANMPFLKNMIDLYNSIQFYQENGSLNQKTIVTYTTEMLYEQGLVNKHMIQKIAGFTIYPEEYFCPMDSQSGDIRITEKTYAIHHYSASWHSASEKLKKKILKILGPQLTNGIVKLKHKFRGII